MRKKYALMKNSNDHELALKDIVDKISSEFGLRERKITREALYCISKNLSRTETTEKLTKLLGRSKARDYTNKLYDESHNLRKRKYNKSSSSKEEELYVKRPRKDEENNQFEKNNIEEKKEIATFLAPAPETPSVPNRYIIEASEKTKQVTMLHSKINEQLAKHGLVQPIIKQADTLIDPNKTRISVKLNEIGQTVDAITGVPITLVHHTPTAKINIRAKRKQVVQAVSTELKRVVPKPSETTSSSLETAHFDPRMHSGSSERYKRDFKFNEPGKFTRMAQVGRTKVHLERLQDKVQSIAAKTGIADATKLAMVTLRHEAETGGKTPDVEWWDASILPLRSYSAFQKFRSTVSLQDFDKDLTAQNKLKDLLVGITNLVEHPVPRLPPGEANSHALPIFLTKAEQSKIRTQRRRQAEKEKQEKIILGLMPPPPPKGIYHITQVKMSNLMRVLGTEAVQDPTKVEAYVKGQIEARKKAHDEANAARKLTPAQKKAKLIKKYKEDTSVAVHISVYRIWDLSNRSKRFKLDMNAQQNYITGCVLLHQNMNLILMEGGKKAQKRMKRLLLHRIKWSDDVIGGSKKGSQPSFESVYNKCILVWEGTSGYRMFKNWEFKNVESEAIAREFLKKHHADHYWDLAYNIPSETTA